MGPAITSKVPAKFGNDLTACSPETTDIRGIATRDDFAIKQVLCSQLHFAAA